MSMLARTALRVPKQVAIRQQARALHFENEIGRTVPMNTDSKPKTAIKLAIYACTGFGLPFYAMYHHLAKSAAST